LFANCRYAIFVPSGEYEGELRREPVGAVTSALLVPPAAASITRIVVPVAPTPCTNAIFVPSGEISGSNGPWNWFTGPETGAPSLTNVGMSASTSP
jgi:hypothetical protein